MRIVLGMILVMALAGACASPDDGPLKGTDSGADSTSPDVQSANAEKALKAAIPAITSTLGDTEATFGGSFLPCRLGNNSLEYTINGMVSGSEDVASASYALRSRLVDEGWEAEKSVSEGSVGLSRDGVRLTVLGAPAANGVTWTIQVTGPCISYSSEDADAARETDIVDHTDAVLGE